MLGFTILRLYSDCSPNVFRMYSDCTPTISLRKQRRAGGRATLDGGLLLCNPLYTGTIVRNVRCKANCGTHGVYN